MAVKGHVAAAAWYVRRVKACWSVMAAVCKSQENPKRSGLVQNDITSKNGPVAQAFGRGGAICTPNLICVQPVLLDGPSNIAKER